MSLNKCFFSLELFTSDITFWLRFKTSRARGHLSWRSICSSSFFIANNKIPQTEWVSRNENHFASGLKQKVERLHLWRPSCWQNLKMGQSIIWCKIKSLCVVSESSHFSYKSTRMTLSDLHHFPKIPPLDCIVKLSSHTYYSSHTLQMKLLNEGFSWRENPVWMIAPPLTGPGIQPLKMI